MMVWPKSALSALLAALLALSLPSVASAKSGSSPKRTQARGSASHKAKKKPTPPPVIELEHLTTHHHLSLQPSPGGGFSKRKMQEVSSFLRCHHTGRRHPMNERLVSILYQVARHYKNAKLFIVAGYRAPKIAKQKGNPRSPHKRGVATDFQVEGVAIESVRDYLRANFHNIGVGYYPNSGFVHVDVGRQKDAFWIDYSGPGEKARYSPPSLRRDSRRSPQVAEAVKKPAKEDAEEKRPTTETDGDELGG